MIDRSSVMKPAGAQTAPRNERFAARLRGRGPVGVFVMVAICAGSAIVPGLGAVLVLIWAWASRTPWPTLGFSRPNNWVATILIGAALGLSLRALTKLVVMPLLGAPATNPAFQHLEGNAAALAMAIFMMGFVAAFGEEVVMRGFLFERLKRLFGTSITAIASVLFVTSILFGVAHHPLQGIAGAQHATLMGLVFGLLFIATGRLWLPVITHATYNLAGLAIIYFGIGPELTQWFWTL